MANLADTLGGGSITFNLNGKNYKGGQITLGDWADFQNHIQQKHRADLLSTAKEVYGDNIPTEIFDKLSAPLSDDAVMDAAATATGARYLLWKSLVAYSPNMTIEEVGDMIGLADVGDIITKLMSGFEKKTKRQRQPVKKKKK